MSGTALAAYTPEEFATLQRLIDSGSWVELRTFLLQNPDLLSREDAVSSELRRFLDNTADLYTSLTFTPAMFPDLAVSPAPIPRARVDVDVDATEDDALANLDLDGLGFAARPEPQAASATQSLAAPPPPTIY